MSYAAQCSGLRHWEGPAADRAAVAIGEAAYGPDTPPLPLCGPTLSVIPAGPALIASSTIAALPGAPGDRGYPAAGACSRSCDSKLPPGSVHSGRV